MNFLKSLVSLKSLTVAVFAAGLLTGCSSWTPEQRAAVEATVANIAIAAAQQYASNGNIDKQQLAFNAISGAAALLRTLESKSAPSPEALQWAVTAGSAHPELAAKLAPSVIVTVQSAMQNGATPAAAVESAARGLDSAATSVAQAGP